VAVAARSAAVSNHVQPPACSSRRAVRRRAASSRHCRAASARSAAASTACLARPALRSHLSIAAMSWLPAVCAGPARPLARCVLSSLNPSAEHNPAGKRVPSLHAPGIVELSTPFDDSLEARELNEAAHTRELLKLGSPVGRVRTVALPGECESLPAVCQRVLRFCPSPNRCGPLSSGRASAFLPDRRRVASWTRASTALDRPSSAVWPLPRSRLRRGDRRRHCPLARGPGGVRTSIARRRSRDVHSNAARRHTCSRGFG
jgi:hypothetical protein